jgi:hypothetical protein
LSKKTLLVMTLGILQLIALFSASTVQSTNSTPTILLNPKIVHARVGSTIAVDLVVDNVTNLGGWFVSIQWNPKIIKLTTGDPNGTERSSSFYLNLYEGPFLRDHGATAFIINTLDQASGKLEFGELFKFLGVGVGVTGNGVVASMNFTILDFGFTTLQITKSVLGDKDNRIIQHDAQNSSVVVFSICVDD